MYEPRDTSAGGAATAVLPRRHRERASGAPELPRVAGRSAALQVALTTAPIGLADLVGLALPLALLSTVSAACGAPQVNAWGWLGAFAALTFTLAGLYPPLGLDPVREVARLCAASGLSFFLLMVHDATAAPLGADRLLVLGGAWLCAWPTLVGLRAAMRSLCARAPWWGLNTLVVGEAWPAERVVHDLGANPQIGLRPLARQQQLPPTTPQLHRRSRCHPELVRLRAPFVVFALPADDAEAVQQTIRAHFASVPNLVVAGATRGGPGTARRVDCRGLAGLLVQPWLTRRSSHALRRAFSLVVMLPLGLLSLPLFVLVALLIKLDSPGPVLYAQERIGVHRKRIRVWKFRTMVRDADAALAHHLEQHPELREEWQRLHKLKDDPRVTRLGKLLRKTSLDEIPQIWNVIRGDMCLVGPRPIVEAEVP
jgi:hypothetical protein